MNFDYRVILSSISGIITIAAVLPYLIDVIKNKTKPRIVSWSLWTLLTGISCAAAISEGEYFTAAMLGSSSFITLLVTIVGWKKGDKKISNFDKVCFIVAILGLILWQVLGSTSVAILISILVDFTACVPTLVHSWKNPNEETWTTFALSGLAATLTIFTISEWNVAAAAFPVYLLVINLIVSGVIIFRKRTIKECQ